MIHLLVFRIGRPDESLSSIIFTTVCLTIIRVTVFPYVFGGLGDDSALNHTIAAAGAAVKANPEPRKKVSMGGICVGDIDL